MYYQYSYGTFLPRAEEAKFSNNISNLEFESFSKFAKSLGTDLASFVMKELTKKL